MKCFATVAALVIGAQLGTQSAAVKDLSKLAPRPEPIRMTYHNVELRDVLNTIKSGHNITFDLAPGVDPRQQIAEFSVERVTIAEAIAMLLDGVNLDYEATDENTIRVTTHH